MLGKCKRRIRSLKIIMEISGGTVKRRGTWQSALNYKLTPPTTNPTCYRDQNKITKLKSMNMRNENVEMVLFIRSHCQLISLAPIPVIKINKRNIVNMVENCPFENRSPPPFYYSYGFADSIQNNPRKILFLFLLLHTKSVSIDLFQVKSINKINENMK